MQNVRQSSAAGTMMDQFPAGLRVLVVDDDRTCLAILEKMLLHCSYKVTTCGTARAALALLRENKQRFDVVISDVYMPDMDGFKLLELVGLEMDLPVIMMSADGETRVVMKGITHGACDYLLKPIRLKELRNIWQHVIRKRRNFIKDVDSAVNSEHDRSKRRDDEGDSLIPTNPKKRKEVKEEDDDIEVDTEDSTTLKKPRVVWSVDLHQQFVNAVNQLGIDKAVPKRILELMSVQGLTRENVASHLQKYRLYLKRLSVAQHQNAVGMTIGSEPSFSPVDGLPHPASSQTLAAIQSAYLGRLCSPNGMGSNAMESSVFVVQPRVPPNNQRNLFSGVSDMDQLTQSQIPGQMRPPQDGHLFPTSSGLGDGTIPSCVNNSLAEQLFQQQQVPHYGQKQGGAFLDFSPVKLSNEVNLRNAILDDGAVGVVNAMPNRSFNTGILGSNVPSATDSGTSSLLITKRPSSTGMNASLKCEESDSLTSWGGCSNYGMQNRISWQGQAPDTVQTSGAPYSSENPDTFQKAGDELLQNQDYMAGLLGPPLGNNTLKVKEEQTFDSIVPSGFSVEHIPDDLLRICYKQEQDTGFFENELGLEGYAPGNLYVK